MSSRDVGARAAAPSASMEEAPVDKVKRKEPVDKVKLDVEGAASTTSFATKLALLSPFLGVTALAAALGAPLWVGITPSAVLVSKFVRKEDDESWPVHIIKVCGLATTWSVWAIFVAWLPLFLLLGTSLNSWHALCIYAPLVVIAAKPNRDHAYSRAERFLLRTLFDFPLVTTALWLRYLGIRLFAPFATVLCDEIVQGTMPLTAADVKLLASAPYNVGAVVNMCSEWRGPEAAYAAHGIVQCRLPFQDTGSPTAEALRNGAAFVKAQLAAMPPGKRVFVHCKGGIARASCMTMAHYLVNNNMDIHDAIAHIKEKRPIVMKSVSEYTAVKALVDGGVST